MDSIPDQIARSLANMRLGKPTHTFVDELLADPEHPWLREILDLVPPGLDPLVLAAGAASEADKLALTLAARSVRVLGTDDRIRFFETLYVLWRFGSETARLRALREGDDLLPLLPKQASGQLHLKLGLMAVDEVDADRHICSARALGVPIPKLPGGQASAIAPVSGWNPPRDADVALIAAGSQRLFRPAGGDGWHPSFAVAATRVPDLHRVSIANGSLSVDTTGDRPRFYVHDGAGRLIPELSAGDEPFLEPPLKVDGTLALLDDWHSAFNVCHALFDKLTRLGAYERLEGLPFTAITFEDTAWYRQALAFLEVAHLHPSSPRWTVTADTLSVLTNHRRGEILHPAFSAAPHALAFIASNLQATGPGRRRIYVSRRDTAIRSTVNEPEIETLFLASGFEIRTLSGLHFEEQKALFQDASHIAGIHGAGLANLVFSHPSTRVLEMMPPNNGSFAYWVMATALGMDYWLHTVEDAHLDTGPGASFDMMLNLRDCRVDADRLRPVLEEFVG